MKIYCIDEDCPNKPKGYAICTALMDVKDCPERKKKDFVREMSEDFFRKMSEDELILHSISSLPVGNPELMKAIADCPSRCLPAALFESKCSNDEQRTELISQELIKRYG